MRLQEELLFLSINFFLSTCMYVRKRANCSKESFNLAYHVETSANIYTLSYSKLRFSGVCIVVVRFMFHTTAEIPSYLI